MLSVRFYFDRLDLHSFPTRRSSDLFPKKTCRPSSANLSWASRPSFSFWKPRPSWRKQKLRSRSEEHTSELQSRRDLVCRLLLEKKKQNPNLRSHVIDHPLPTAVFVT